MENIPNAARRRVKVRGSKSTHPIWSNHKLGPFEVGLSAGITKSWMRTSDQRRECNKRDKWTQRKGHEERQIKSPCVVPDRPD